MKSLQLFSEQYNNSPVLDPIPYKETDLEPVISKQTIDYHFNNLAKTYLKRYNNNEGDPKFNLAGVYLHNLYFQQFQKPNKENKPIGISKTIIDQKYNSFTEFKKQIEKTAMSIRFGLSGIKYISDKIAERYIQERTKKRSLVKRFCKSCGTLLSMYNDSHLCQLCDVNPKDVSKALKDMKKMLS